MKYRIVLTLLGCGTMLAWPSALELRLAPAARATYDVKDPRWDRFALDLEAAQRGGLLLLVLDRQPVNVGSETGTGAQCGGQSGITWGKQGTPTEIVSLADSGLGGCGFRIALLDPNNRYENLRLYMTFTPEKLPSNESCLLATTPDNAIGNAFADHTVIVRPVHLTAPPRSKNNAVEVIDATFGDAKIRRFIWQSREYIDKHSSQDDSQHLKENPAVNPKWLVINNSASGQTCKLGFVIGARPGTDGSASKPLSMKVFFAPAANTAMPIGTSKCRISVPGFMTHSINRPYEILQGGSPHAEEFFFGPEVGGCLLQLEMSGDGRP